MMAHVYAWTALGMGEGGRGWIKTDSSENRNEVVHSLREITTFRFRLTTKTSRTTSMTIITSSTPSVATPAAIAPTSVPELESELGAD